VGTGVVDVTPPQIVHYEAQPDGGLKLTGADYLVVARTWGAAHPGVTPQLIGQIFHYFEAPNRFGLPGFYTLHVWAWKDNPKARIRKLASQSFVPVFRRPNHPLVEAIVVRGIAVVSTCLLDQRGCSLGRMAD
jgi:hypothetical protein